MNISSNVIEVTAEAMVPNRKYQNERKTPFISVNSVPEMERFSTAEQNEHVNIRAIAISIPSFEWSVMDFVGSVYSVCKIAVFVPVPFMVWNISHT